MNCPECGHANADWRSNCEKCGRTLAEFRSDLTALPTKRTKCWHCGYENTAAQGSVCVNCGVSLKQPGSRSHVPRRVPPHREAPILVKIYAIVLFIGAGIIGFDSFSLLKFSFFLFILVLGLAVMQGLAAAGIWNMKKWGRNLVIISQGLNILSNLYTVITTPSYVRLPMCGNFIGIVISGVILFWFLAYGDLFDN